MWFTAVDIASTPGGHAGMQSSQPLQCSTSIVTVPRLLIVVRRAQTCAALPLPGGELVRRAGGPTRRGARARWLRCAACGTAGSTRASPRRARRCSTMPVIARSTRRASPSTPPSGLPSSVGDGRWPATRCTVTSARDRRCVNVVSFTSTRPPGRSFGSTGAQYSSCIAIADHACDTTGGACDRRVGRRRRCCRCCRRASCRRRGRGT